MLHAEEEEGGEKAWLPTEWPEAFQTLAKEFENVLVTELTPEDRIQCPQQELKVKEGVAPHFAKRPRQSPLHWKDKIEEEKKKLIREGVIQRVVGEQPLWVSPAGFVAKDKTEEKLRLVCDLYELNAATKGNTSVNPTSSQVMEALDPDST